MSTSRNRTALDALALAATRIGATPVDAALARREARRLHPPEPQTDRPMLVVIGGPRTGSTLIYPYLCQQLGAPARFDPPPLPELRGSTTVRLSRSDQAIVTAELD